MTTPTEQIQKDLEQVLNLAAKDNSKQLAAEIVSIVTEALSGNLKPPISMWQWSDAPKQLKELLVGGDKGTADWVILITKQNKEIINLLPIDLTLKEVQQKELWDGATILFLY